MSIDNVAKTPSRRLQRSFVDRLRRGLFIPVLMLLTGLILSFAVGIFVSYNQQRLGDQRVSVQSDLDTILSSMVDQETGLRGYISTNDPSFLAPFNSGRPQYLSSVQHLKDQLQGGGFNTTAASLIMVETAASNWYDNFATVQMRNMETGNVAVARADATIAREKTLFDQFRSAMTQLQASANRDLVNMQGQANTIDVIVVIAVAILSIVAMLFLWNTFHSLTRTLRNQFAILNETATQFGAGNFTVRVRGLRDTELGQLGRTFNTMAVSLQEQQSALKDRDILESVLQLNTILTKSLDLDVLTHEFLQTTLSLLDVHLGALYLYDRQKNNLALFTALGLSQGEMEKEFQLGEGLIGRAAQMREPLYVAQKEDRQRQDFRIKTLLGYALPASLYHIPLIRGSELLGVLSLGSLYPINENARNVLNVVASNLAAAVSNTRAYRHIQEQAEELVLRGREQERANTALRRQRDDLTVLNAALEEANRARSQFLSTMSHELRTPLTSIIGFSQILLRGTESNTFTQRQKSNIERITKNGQHLLSLINDVLDLAKIEAGHTDVNYRQVNIQELIPTLVEETQSIAIERGLQLRADVEPALPTLETDPMKLRQVLLNLVSNALKFTEKGEVVITAKLAPASTLPGIARDEVGEQIAIAVKDTGIGISPEMQSRIFDAFYQVDGSNTRKYGGTGLGLSIVRQLTTLLGGTLDVQSAEGQGSTFTVLLPLHARKIADMQQNLRLHAHAVPSSLDHGASGALAIPSYDDEQDQGAKEATTEHYIVLSVDDNPDVLHLIDSALENSPYEVVSVSDSTRVMAMVHNLQPSAVTLDVMMPDLNGWQLLHELKSNPRTAHIPVIMLTVLEDRSVGYVLGADEYLVKPIERNALLSTLQRFVKRHATLPPPTEIHDASADTGAGDAQTAMALNRQEAVKPHQIVVVDDEKATLITLERLLSEGGFTVRTIREGSDTLDIIQQTDPDVVILHLLLSAGDTSQMLTRLVSSAANVEGAFAKRVEKSEQGVPSDT